MAWWSATREVLRYEWLLLATHRKLAVAAVGLLFVPALYALIYLWGMWDPAAHTRALPAGLVNLDTGATYRGRDLNMGAEVLAAIERQGQFSYRRFSEAAEARWELVFTTAAGSQRNLDSLRTALADLHHGAADLGDALRKARDGSQALAAGGRSAADAAGRLRTSAAQLADAAPQLSTGIRQVGTQLRGIDARRPADAELAALRLGARQLADGQRELARGIEALAIGSRELAGGLDQFKAAADEVPLFGSRLVDGLAPLALGSQQLVAGLDAARDGSSRLQQGTQRMDEAMAALTDGTQRAGTVAASLATRLLDEPRLDSFVDGVRDLARGSEVLQAGVRQLALAQDTLHAGLDRLLDGAGRLGVGLQLLHDSLPLAVDAPGGSARGLALSVEPVVEVVARCCRSS